MVKRLDLRCAIHLMVVGSLTVLIFGCDGGNVNTSAIDCDIDDIDVTSTLQGTVSPSGDTVIGDLTFTCDGVGVSGVNVTGSAGWWNIVQVGPSDSNGVISVAKPAEALGRDDIGTTKTVNLNVYSATGETKVVPISVDIN